MKEAIAVENIGKRFKKVEAVSGISFTVGKGELFGFLGPNGAGKTTTINMITGLARPDFGTIRIGGIDCTNRSMRAQQLIGVVPDESNLYPELTGFDNLSFCAALYGLRKRERQTRAHELLEAFGLSRAADRRFGAYSKGMKRKLTIAAGIIHKPEVLFLDEPTTGIDVASSRKLRQLIKDLHQSGTTIFLTTHYIEEAERLCDRIAFIVSGRIIRIDTTENLLHPFQAKYGVQITYENDVAGIMGKLSEAYPELEFSLPKNGMIQADANKPIQAGAVVHFLEDQGMEVSEAKKIKPSIEDVFVRITGIEADAMRKEKEKGGGGQ